MPGLTHRQSRNFTPSSPDSGGGATALQPAGNRAALDEMAACPSDLASTDPTPDGWKDYMGDPGVFHCGFRGILEDRSPTQRAPMNECFYDDEGALVDEDHQWADCGGTPDSFDASEGFWDAMAHTFLDPGGIVHSGWDAFWASRAYGMPPNEVRPHEVPGGSDLPRGDVPTDAQRPPDGGLGYYRLPNNHFVAQ